MKVYVCYDSDEYEGCSPPSAVFSTKEKAEEWVREKSSTIPKWMRLLSYEYAEMEVE